MKTFHYEVPTNNRHLSDGPLVRIFCSEDNKLMFMASCMNEDTAKTIVQALNSMDSVGDTEAPQSDESLFASAPVWDTENRWPPAPAGYLYWKTETWKDPVSLKSWYINIYRNSEGKKWAVKYD